VTAEVAHNCSGLSHSSQDVVRPGHTEADSSAGTGGNRKQHIKSTCWACDWDKEKIKQKPGLSFHSCRTRTKDTLRFLNKSNIYKKVKNVKYKNIKKRA